MLTNRIHARAISQYEDWKRTATEEIKQRGADKLERFRTDENYREERMQKMHEIWDEADANKDKLLNREEYRNFKTLMMAEAEQQGDWCETTDNTDLDYELMHSIQNNDKGISMDDMMRIMGPWMLKFEELKHLDDTSVSGQSSSMMNQNSNN